MVPKLPLSNFAKNIVCLFKYFKQGKFIYLFIDKKQWSAKCRYHAGLLIDNESSLMSHVE